MADELKEGHPREPDVERLEIAGTVDDIKQQIQQKLSAKNPSKGQLADAILLHMVATSRVDEKVSQLKGWIKKLIATIGTATVVFIIRTFLLGM